MAQVDSITAERVSNGWRLQFRENGARVVTEEVYLSTSSASTRVSALFTAT